MAFTRRISGWVPPATALAVAVLVAPTAPTLRAQSVTTGAIGGTAVSGEGRFAAGVYVTMTHHATGWERTVVTDAFGRYRSPALPPGRYDLLAERLGFRPLVVPDVTVSPGSTVSLDLRLTPADPPVTQVDTMAFVEGALHASLARGNWDAGNDLVDLVDPLGRVPALSDVAAVSSGGLGMEGLPDRLGSVGVDGIPRSFPASPGVSRADLSALGLPFTGLNHAEIVSGTDVEWPGFGGGLVSAFTARGPRQAEVRGFGDADGRTFRGGLLAGGPLVPDTAWGILGVDARRIRTRFGAPWPNDSLASLAAGFARDSLGTDLSGYLRPVTTTTDVITAFGRFDWEIVGGQLLSLRAALSDASSSNLDLGAGRFVGLGTSSSARDVSLSGAFTSHLVGALRADVSLAIDRSTRDFGAPTLPGTVFVTDGVTAGADGALPGSFERDETRFFAALLLRVHTHEFKVGVLSTSTNHDIRYDPWRAGTYLFGSVDDLLRRRGVFMQSVGGTPAASFTITSQAAFLQDSWAPLVGLNILFGVRFFERENWPTGGVAADAAWQSLTGVSNAFVPNLKARTSPRLSFTWAAGSQRQWLLRADAGQFAESVDPTVLAEVQTHDGAAAFRRGVGALGAWPGVPDSTAAPVTGPVLTLLNPGFQSPRTSRVGLSLARQLGSGVTLQVGGQYRHTEYLPRRNDLNLAPAALSTDQYGRPIFGVLQQVGSVLVAVPGSNRRFGAFDRVWALDPSGYSDYSGVTVSLERIREHGLSLWASYTYSHTTDNTPGLAGSLPDAQVSPFPSASGLTDWRNGRSDLDVPHRVVLGAELSRGRVRVAALVRYRSGLPFTPGFRDGVDANGDGAAGNDPAFVSDTVAGASAVLGRWACLRQQAGQFAARNSCRGPAVVSADARLVVQRLFAVRGASADLVVDAINLVATNDGVLDRALYLVDPTRTIATNAVTGVVTVPLVANPNFGKFLVRRSPSAGVRAGLRFAF
jgi:hypothetical protein